MVMSWTGNPTELSTITIVIIPPAEAVAAPDASVAAMLKSIESRFSVGVDGDQQKEGLASYLKVTSCIGVRLMWFI